MAAETTLTGRVVVITGGARGIGLATAKALHARGASVAIGDLDAQTVAAAASEIGSDVLGGVLDVTDRGSFEQFVALVERELGPLDVLINNAGIMPLGRFHEESDAAARKLLDVNVLGCMTGMKIALAGMVDRGRGHIVNIASAAGKSPPPGGVSYAATKAAVVMLTEGARVEYAGTGIQFTCVMPSFTATELIAGTKGTKFVPTIQPEDVGEAVARAVAAPRPDVYVPRSIGPMVRLQQLTGRRVRDAMSRALGADRTFLDVDQAARASYDGRIAASGGAEAGAESDAESVSGR
jgi:NAD(P)-dependent dehydrogenase (short-subunit alcohol dehydrogenase family)